MSEFVFIVTLAYLGVVFRHFHFEILACSRFFFSSPQVLTMTFSTQIVIAP